jgi:Ser/Thr protein kinase RdoA (MazF antagonist)
MPEIERHDRGMNSRTWLVTNGPDRYVAKAVPPDAHRRFVSGLAVASHVEAAGIPAGAAIPTREGRSFVRLDGGTLALLTFVTGAGLGCDSYSDQRLIGTTLAGVHRALIGQRVADADRFHWIDPAAEHLDIRAWVRPAIVGVLASWEHLPPASLSWSLLHSDPAPEAFLLDADTGVCGLIDWDMGLVGPLMYDVASAVMYVGGPDRAAALIDAYLSQGVLEPAEVQRALGPMLRMRWAVQADYFARRIASNDLTGTRVRTRTRRDWRTRASPWPDKGLNVTDEVSRSSSTIGPCPPSTTASSSIATCRFASAPARAAGGFPERKERGATTPRRTGGAAPRHEVGR